MAVPDVPGHGWKLWFLANVANIDVSSGVFICQEVLDGFLGHYVRVMHYPYPSVAEGCSFIHTIGQS